jgi:type IV pilus assembly protein PilV
MRNLQQGSSLLEGLVTLAIFTFGMLGLASLQTRMIEQGTNAQLRVQASYLAEEMLGLAAADKANVACYQMTSTGPSSCGNTVAHNAAVDWRSRVLAALPGASASPPTVTYAVNGQLAITILWQRTQELTQHNYVSTTNLYPGS